jgi:oligopeptide transport system permease protein
MSGLMSFVLKRLGWMVATAWVVYTFSFFLMYAVPGGPYSRERRLPPVLEQRYKERYRLDDPVYKQYLDSLWDANFPSRRRWGFWRSRSPSASD